jgi:DnaK suppressor protein
MTTPSHTKEFMEEMKQKLLIECEQLKDELKNDAHKEHGEYQATYPDYGRHEDENASEIADYTVLTATTDALEKRLADVEVALQKIETGGYGLTAGGEIIPEDRLRANPAATTLVA